MGREAGRCDNKRSKRRMLTGSESAESFQSLGICERRFAFGRNYILGEV